MMITEIEDFFTKGCGRCARFATADCSTRIWAQGLAELRRFCQQAGLVEVVKWGHPCYMHSGRNIAIIGAFRGDFRLTFFSPSLLQDPNGLLEKPGPNAQHPAMIRFTDTAQVVAFAPAISAFLAEAMGYAQAGIKPPKQPSEIELPDELIAALDDDPDLAKAFHALTPGRHKSYVIALGSAKTSATRVARIGRFRDRILAGKGALER